MVPVLLANSHSQAPAAALWVISLGLELLALSFLELERKKHAISFLPSIPIPNFEVFAFVL